MLLGVIKKKTAFTLVELLVVISIIALLLAVLMPALQKAREQGRRVVCKANVHQLGIAFYSYGTDNKKYPLGHAWNYPYECYPNVYNSALGISNASDYFIGNALRKYLANNDLTVFSCPANKRLGFARTNFLKKGQWYGWITWYFYFGNYPMEQSLNSKWIYTQTSIEADLYNRGVYPQNPIQSKRAKLLQDMIYSTKTGFDTLYGTSHEKPSCLYTDGSVEEKDRRALSEHRRSGLTRSYSLPLW